MVMMRAMTKRLAVLLTLCLAAPGLAACGDDDGGSGGSGGALAKAELVKEADRICEAAAKELGKVGQPQNIADAAQASEYFGKVTQVTTKLQKDLEGLEPASDVKAQWDAFISEQGKATKLLEDVAAKAKAKDASGLAQLQDLDKIGTSVQQKADALGLDGCGS